MRGRCFLVPGPIAGTGTAHPQVCGLLKRAPSQGSRTPGNVMARSWTRSATWIVCIGKPKV